MHKREFNEPGPARMGPTCEQRACEPAEKFKPTVATATTKPRQRHSVNRKMDSFLFLLLLLLSSQSRKKKKRKNRPNYLLDVHQLFVIKFVVLGLVGLEELQQESDRLVAATRAGVLVGLLEKLAGVAHRHENTFWISGSRHFFNLAAVVEAQIG